MTNEDDAAFGHGAENGHCCGLTKREYFAAMAMQGICADPQTWEMTFAAATDSAVGYADALIEALNK